MENNITSVQFIKEQIELDSDTSFFNIDWDKFDEVIEKAKAMEKEQKKEYNYYKEYWEVRNLKKTK